MIITQDDRMKAYRSAPALIADAYGSLETAILLGTIRERYSIREGAFIHLVGDTILRLRTYSEFESRLASEIGLSSDVVRMVTKDLQPFFEKIHETTIPTVTAPEAPSQQPVLTREELMKALESKRTMASDTAALNNKPAMAAEKPVVGYGSTEG